MNHITAQSNKYILYRVVFYCVMLDVVEIDGMVQVKAQAPPFQRIKITPVYTGIILMYLLSM